MLATAHQAFEASVEGDLGFGVGEVIVVTSSEQVGTYGQDPPGVSTHATDTTARCTLSQRLATAKI